MTSCIEYVNTLLRFNNLNQFSNFLFSYLFIRFYFFFTFSFLLKLFFFSLHG